MTIMTVLKKTAAAAFIIGGLAACAEEQSDAEMVEEESADMAEAASSMADGHGDAMEMDNSHLDAVLDGTVRTDDERARDADRKPVEVLTFFEVKPGDKVLELAAGGGYYTKIISAAVGSEGMVYAQNSENFWPRLKDTVEPVYAELGNVEPVITGTTEAANGIADGSLDSVLIILIYHHMHYNADEGEAMPAATKGFFDEAMRALKPGGVLGIVEHEAAEGTTRAEANDWHRVQQSVAVADATNSGFEFVGEGNMLDNPDDDLKNYWREALERGKSQRIVLNFRKPE